MSSTQTIPDSVLDELLDNDVPCGDCGKPALLKSLGHHGHPPHYKCLACWKSWLSDIMGDIRMQGYVVCRACKVKFPTVESFSDYREF